MTVNQIYQLLNTIVSETTGQTGIVAEDLSNIVTVGETIFDNTTWRDNYVKSLINQIGRMIFVDRPYRGFAPNIQRDSWEYGSILAKVAIKSMQAKPNPSWQLQAGQTVDQFQFNPPDVQQRFYNMRDAWQIDLSRAEKQVKESFKSAAEFNAFFTAIYQEIDNSSVDKLDALTMRTINNFMGERINANVGVIDVLGAYAADTGDTTLTAAQALTSERFGRYLAYTILTLKDQLKPRSNIYNQGTAGYLRGTPDEDLHVVLHSKYARSMEVFMQADAYHDDLVKIGSYDRVPFWQGSGTGYAISDTTQININLASDNETTVNRGYIIGTMFDRDAMAICNDDRRVTSSYNANGEYYNSFYKFDTTYMNDLTENGVVLVLGNGT